MAKDNKQCCANACVFYQGDKKTRCWVCSLGLERKEHTDINPCFNYEKEVREFIK